MGGGQGQVALGREGTSHLMCVCGLFFPIQEPKLGECHQALVPDYAPSTPYPTTEAKSADKLMWSPRGISEEQGQF